jgi:hypothetical protein
MEELQTVKLNAIIDVKISQAYYVQLQSIVISLIKSLKPSGVPFFFNKIGKL